MTKTKVAKKGEFTGRHMAIIMVAFFAVIVVVNLTMATLANRSWTGLVVKNSYVESQKYNAKLEQSRQQAARGWTGVLSSLDSGLKFQLTDRTGRGVEAEQLSITFRRPVNEAKDQTVVLKNTGAGAYIGDVALGKGNWVAEVVAQATGQTPWKLIYRILINENGKFQTVSNEVRAEK